MRSKRTLVAALAIVLPLSAAPAAPAGWKPMTSDGRKCSAMVPGNWGPAVTGAGMQVPGGRSHAMLNLDSGSMDDFKAMMATMYRVTKAVENSPGRYWVELAGAKGNNMREWRLAVPASGGICTAFIAFDRTLSEADAKTIAMSVKKR